MHIFVIIPQKKALIGIIISKNLKAVLLTINKEF